MVSVKTIVVVLALGVEALAAGTTCSTQMNTVSVTSVPTKTSTKTTTVTETKKITTTKNKTVTPSPTILTTTVTSTVVKTKTAGAATKTATVTTTYNNEITQPVYVTDSTVTSTNTIYSTTTTTPIVPPPPGFTAIQDTPGYVAKRDTANFAKRQNSAASAKKYPQKVDCAVIVTKTATVTSTSIVNGKTTTLKPATSIQTATITSTKTSTKFPADVSTTYTSTVTNDVVVFDEIHETATETTSITVQTVVPGTPYYQACGNPRNIRSTANGGYKITSISIIDQFVLVDSVTDPYNCCVACQTATNCRGSALKSNQCYIMLANTCTPGQLTLNQFKTSAMGVAYYMSNGPCGLIKNAGTNNPM